MLNTVDGDQFSGTIPSSTVEGYHHGFGGITSSTVEDGQYFGGIPSNAAENKDSWRKSTKNVKKIEGYHNPLNHINGKPCDKYLRILSIRCRLTK